MHTPAKSRLGRRYTCRPPHAPHPNTKPVARLCGVAAQTAPQPIDLRPSLSPVRDQGQEQDCFAFATAAMLEYVHGLVTEKEWLSPAYVAWRVRVTMGVFPADSGASISDAVDEAVAWGAPPEAFLPYQQDPREAPPDDNCDIAARVYRISDSPVVDISDGAAVREVLSSKRVIEIGFTCTESWEDTGHDGAVPPPRGGILGGHANLLCGWRLNAQGGVEYISRNSYSSAWGDDGYCYFPEAVLQALVFEARTTA